MIILFVLRLAKLYSSKPEVDISKKSCASIGFIEDAINGNVYPRIRLKVKVSLQIEQGSLRCTMSRRIIMILSKNFSVKGSETTVEIFFHQTVSSRFERAYTKFKEFQSKHTSKRQYGRHCFLTYIRRCKRLPSKLSIHVEIAWGASLMLWSGCE